MFASSARLFVLLSTTIAASVGCGSADTPPNHPVQCPPGYAFDGRGCASLASAPSTPPSTASSAADSAPPPPPSTSAKPLDPAAATAATALIGPAAQVAAPGAKPMNVALAGEFSQGQVLESAIELEAGKCYTAVGAGAPPIQNLDLQFLAATPLPGVAPVIAQDQTVGPVAVVGEKPNCFKALFSGPIKIALKVASGQGIAAAEVYVK